MDRYDMALKKEAIPDYKEPEPEQIEIVKGPESSNLMLSGPCGTRLIVPLSQLRYSYGNGCLDIKINGSGAHQLAEDIKKGFEAYGNLIGTMMEQDVLRTLNEGSLRSRLNRSIG